MFSSSPPTSYWDKRCHCCGQFTRPSHPQFPEKKNLFPGKFPIQVVLVHCKSTRYTRYHNIYHYGPGVSPSQGTTDKLPNTWSAWETPLRPSNSPTDLSVLRKQRSWTHPGERAARAALQLESTRERVRLSVFKSSQSLGLLPDGGFFTVCFAHSLLQISNSVIIHFRICQQRWQEKGHKGRTSTFTLGNTNWPRFRDPCSYLLRRQGLCWSRRRTRAPSPGLRALQGDRGSRLRGPQGRYRSSELEALGAACCAVADNEPPGHV